MSKFPTKVLAATDGSPQAHLAVRMAADLSSRADAELHLVHVGELAAMYHPEMRGYAYRHEASQEGARLLLGEESERLRSAGVNVTKTHLRMGSADVEIIELAEELDADLLVVGSRGLGGFRRLLVGSVSDLVVRHAHCHVLVVREKGARSNPVYPG